MTPPLNDFRNDFRNGFIAFAIALIILLMFIIHSMAERVNQSTIWLDETEEKIQDLESRSEVMITSCNRYLMDMGNDRSN